MSSRFESWRKNLDRSPIAASEDRNAFAVSGHLARAREVIAAARRTATRQLAYPAQPLPTDMSCAWCSNLIAPQEPAVMLGLRLVHDGAPGADCRREFDVFMEG